MTSHCRLSGLPKPTAGCECEACRPDPRDEEQTIESLLTYCKAHGHMVEVERLELYTAQRAAEAA